MAITAVLLYSGPTQQDKWLSTLVPPKKLVPPNRKKTKYTGSIQDTKDDKIFNNWKKLLSSFVSWVGPVYLVIFSVGGDQFHT